MRPQNIQFGGGVAETIVNPVVLAVILIAGLLILFGSRPKALAAILAAGILIPTDQIVILAGVHFPMLRILALFGFARVFWRRLVKREPIFSGGVNAIDKAVIVLASFVALNGMLLWMQSAEIIYQMGIIVTTLGVYFLVRHLIRDLADAKWCIRALAYVAAPIALLMLYESHTGHNPYYEFLGGARARMYSSAIQRGDEFRATGCFGQPILAGTFGGILVPLFVGLWKSEKRFRKSALIGMLATTAIPFAVASSTALFALIAGIGALLWWPLRRGMRLVRWGIVAALAGMQMVMKSPVWHIIEDVSLSNGSSSYHRYMLVDQCIRHFGSWALVGTKNYGSWGFDMWDMSNQYVAYADNSGLIPLIAFLAILVFGFKYVGRTLRYYQPEKSQQFFVWAIGASLFANTVAFFGISYWDQIVVVWLATLAIISAVTLPGQKPAKAVSDLAPEPALLLRDSLSAASVRSIRSNQA